MKYSDLQENIFDAVTNGRGSLAIKALAGSGKTTTIVEACNRIDSSLTATFVAFNKSIASELQMRLPSNIRASTMHAMGYKSIMYSNRGAVMNDNKCRDIYRNILSGRSEIEQVVLRLVSLGKTTDQAVPDFNALMEHFEIVIDAEYIDEAIGFASQVFDLSRQQSNIFDFDDMIYFPAMGECSIYKSDVLFVDEEQDLNPAQIAMINRAVKSTGRVVAVGDEHQAIYGFRGADTDAMNRFINEFNAAVLPLSICYRCGSSIIELAKTLVPEIEAAPNAPKGEVSYVSDKQVLGKLENDDLVICRVNAPLVQLALQCIAQGKRAQIRGRDIGKSLQTFIRKVQRKYLTTSLVDFIRNMTAYVDIEVAKLLASDKTGPANALLDQRETINALAVGANTIDDLSDRIERIFADNITGITLSSIHRAKGTEANRVFILRPDLLPHPMAKTYWQLIQERNLKYVAITRAKQSLTFVTKSS